QDTVVARGMHCRIGKVLFGGSRARKDVHARYRGRVDPWSSHRGGGGARVGPGHHRPGGCRSSRGRWHGVPFGWFVPWKSPAVEEINMAAEGGQRLDRTFPQVRVLVLPEKTP